MSKIKILWLKYAKCKELWHSSINKRHVKGMFIETSVCLHLSEGHYIYTRKRREKFISERDPIK